MINVYTILFRNLEEKGLLQKLSCRWEDGTFRNLVVDGKMVLKEC
jgi:hypothetical protein